jgi:diacylglycerol O-acyltransferase / wax synthase
MTETLTALDATFLELEQLDDGALMSIGGAMVFDPLPGGGAPTLETVRDGLATRLGQLPRYSERLSSTRTGGFAWPHWVTDERFEIANHVRHAALPPPGTDAQLCDHLAEMFSHPLDRSRPLWEIVLVEGLEGGRWAIAQKTHHCLVDGVGSVDVVQLLLDDEPEPPKPSARRPAAGSEVSAASSNGRGLVHMPDAIAQAAGAGTHAAGAVAHAALHPSEALKRSRALVDLMVREGVAGAPGTSLNVPIGQARRFAVLRAPLAELKAIGRDLDGSVNDVVLAACTTGLRRLLERRGERLPERGLRAMVPMNLREESGRMALGNQVTSLFVALPVAEDDPGTRFREIVRDTKRLKQSDAAEGPTALMDLASMAPPVVIRAALARTYFSKRLFNVTITNVPGPQRPLYAFGAQMRDLYPVVPLAADHSVGIALFSYNGVITFGINADCESTPDLEALAFGIEEGLEQLRALSPSAKTIDEVRY